MDPYTGEPLQLALVEGKSVVEVEHMSECQFMGHAMIYSYDFCRTMDQSGAWMHLGCFLSSLRGWWMGMEEEGRRGRLQCFGRGQSRWGVTPRLDARIHTSRRCLPTLQISVLC